ncbi:DUF6236 family protein [Neobacillus drentensis]|uniref:DUF6236 family protein n=1 Tax=Neobacillus drentensis TaxID=220684 RepID=UPI002FFFD6CC
MGFKILYYPRIGVPNNYWLRRVLLYSDKIASIIPESIRYHYDPVIELLLENGEFEPISPVDFLRSKDNELDRRNFEEELRNYILSDSLQKFLNENSFSSKTEISMDKFSSLAVFELANHNLIENIEEKNDRFAMSEVVATIYLGILAKYLGVKYAYTPSTDNHICEKIIFNMSDNQQQGYQVANVQLMNCLPVPSTHTSIEDIIKFKKKRNTELQAFKVEYLDFQQKLANSKSREEVNHYLELFNTKMQKELQLVSRLLNESKISFTLDSIKSLLNTKTPALFAGATTLPYLLNSHPNLSAMAITLGISYIGARQALLKKESESPFSYVFHAHKELGYHRERIQSQ